MNSSILSRPVAALAYLALTVSAAAQTMTVDLSLQKPGESQTVTISPGNSIPLQILNLIPGRQYSVTALVQTKPIAPLDPNALASSRQAIVPKNPPPTPTPQCAALTTAITNITVKDVTESAVPALRADLQRTFDAATSFNCADQAAAALALAGTSRTFDETYNISKGQQLTVTVVRNGDDGKQLTWTKVFDAGDAGSWLVSYGFLFVPSGDQTYYSKSVVDTHGTPTGDYVITQSADRQKLAFAPSVVFGWYPGWNLGAGFTAGLGAGLGFDLSAPIVSVGPLISYNENIALTAGGVFHQVTRLAGQYTAGQTVRENLSSDTLAQKTYAFTYYAGITFRFGSKPAGFGGTSAPSSNPPPTKSPTPPASPSPSPSPFQAPAPAPTPPPPGH